MCLATLVEGHERDADPEQDQDDNQAKPGTCDDPVEVAGSVRRSHDDSTFRLASCKRSYLYALGRLNRGIGSATAAIGQLTVLQTARSSTMVQSRQLITHERQRIDPAVTRTWRTRS